ncbi:MAG: hypothetical protein HC846_08315 [Blastocatellia bacterium]|nr:hypothetical protein [Blastocatellia bacterium]
MKKTKLEERFEKAVNAFFENETLTEQNKLTVFENQQIAQISPAENMAQTADKLFTFFKRIFAFLPGVLFLHIVMPGIFTFGIGIWTLFFLVSGTFMVWAGLGDLKNKKHLWLPISSMLVGLIFSLPFYFLGLSGFSYYVYAYIGILPLLFIAPILTKSRLEKTED